MEMNGLDQSLVAYSDRLVEEPWGLFGGRPGAVSRMNVTYPDGTSRWAKSKDNMDAIPTGSIFHKWTGGGGGFGDPFVRSLELVQEDVRNGLVSAENARGLYGVEIDRGTSQVDETASLSLRAKTTDSAS